MLLVGGVAEAHGDEDEEDEEGPDDLGQQLKLEHTQEVLSIMLHKIPTDPCTPTLISVDRQRWTQVGIPKDGA